MSLKAEHNRCQVVRRAIKPVQYNTYIRMIGDMNSFQMSASISGWEVFEYERHPDGTVSFKTTYFNTYLSTDGSILRCSKCCGSREKYRIQWSGEGQMWIHPVDIPGSFLTTGADGCTLQLAKGSKGYKALFFIYVVK
ncbi:hypothetical protein BDZ91DRAFT_359103 [Kalaharituber pfeilii]|nr:hypothetical protein BDZ91DRAFT_359103 [Kalaharituber pfeilii]